MVCVVLVSVLATVACDGATVVGNLRDITGSPYSPNVRFVPTNSTPQMIGTNTVLDVPHSVQPTNGTFYQQLVGGFYMTDFGPPNKPIFILVPPNDTNTYDFNLCAAWASNSFYFVWTNPPPAPLIAGTNVSMYFTTNGFVLNADVSHTEVATASNVLRFAIITTSNVLSASIGAVSNNVVISSNALAAGIGGVSNNVLTTSNALAANIVVVSNKVITSSNGLASAIGGVSNNVITTSNALVAQISSGVGITYTFIGSNGIGVNVNTNVMPHVVTIYLLGTAPPPINPLTLLGDSGAGTTFALLGDNGSGGTVPLLFDSGSGSRRFP